jgi:hypothetical protein
MSALEREVVLPDLDGRGHVLRLVRDDRGMIYAEVAAKHGGTQVFSMLRLGEAWELIPKLFPLK